MTCTGCQTSGAPYELIEGRCHRCTHRDLVAARSLLDLSTKEVERLTNRCNDLAEEMHKHRLPVPQ